MGAAHVPEGRAGEASTASRSGGAVDALWLAAAAAGVLQAPTQRCGCPAAQFWAAGGRHRCGRFCRSRVRARSRPAIVAAVTLRATSTAAMTSILSSALGWHANSLAAAAVGASAEDGRGGG